MTQSEIDPHYQRNIIFQAFVVLAAQHGYPWGVSLDPDTPGMDVLYLQLPTGQISFHIPHRDLLLVGAPEVSWDGHGREQKFVRIENYIIDNSRRMEKVGAVPKSIKDTA